MILLLFVVCLYVKAIKLTKLQFLIIIMSITSFTELEVYKQCRLLRKRISALVKTHFPPEEKYKLTDQILRSSRGVTACIAEGYGRFHFQENIQFCRTSRGSLLETLEHLITAYDEKYISVEELISFKTDIDVCAKLLNGYINYLSKAKANG
jgi:four helix bundle protein